MKPVPALILEAIRFATRKHQGQVRKDGVTPYSSHPLRVMTHLSVGLGIADPVVLAAAVLHDTIEDTTTDFDDLEEHFGRPVAEIVSRLTKDKRLPEAEREREYFSSLARAPTEVKLLKLADAYDNLLDSAHLPAAARRKSAAKAAHLLDLLGPGVPEAHHPLLAWIRAELGRKRAARPRGGRRGL